MRFAAVLLAVLLAGCAFAARAEQSPPPAPPPPSARFVPFLDGLVLSPDMWGSDGPRRWTVEAERSLGVPVYVLACHGGTYTLADGSRRWDAVPFARCWPVGNLIHFPVRWPAKLLRCLLPTGRALWLVVCNEDGLDLSDRPTPGVWMARDTVWITPVHVPGGVGDARGFREAEPDEGPPPESLED